MPQHLPKIFFLFLLASLWPQPGQAEIFRCVAPNGELTYAQTPCPEKDSKVTVQKSATSNNSEGNECQHAHRFALATAQEMKTGTSSAVVFDRYGGLSALSRGSVSLISYVFQYRTNSDVSAERVAALSVAKCQAHSFGDVSCAELPVEFTNRLGGCEIDGEGTTSAIVGFPPSVAQPMPLQSSNASQRSRITQQASLRQARAADEQRRAECKKKIRSQIDSINSQMRSGYTATQGSSLRNRRRDLEDRMREC